MEVDARKGIISKLQSRVVSIDEFNWDRLMAPPLYSLITQEACNEICRIATSVRYSGNAKLRISKIDEVLKPFGFERKGAGTNRLVYKYLENDTFLLKVAFDAVGMEDNPKEFRNQFIYKPFVTKIFEVDPTGAVALIERVVPITSREEFLTVASNIYDVIRGWFLGDYIMADIGTKFFMNWGIRKNFGPVLLDFPYVYELDGNKLYCNENYSGIICGGEIDYDDGYNFLQCCKCGKRYRVKQLARATENKQIIVKGRESKMQIVAKMGNKIVKSTESNNTFNEEAQAIVKKPVTPDRSGETGKLEVKASFVKTVPSKNNNFKKDNNFNKDNSKHRNNNNFKNGANNRGIVRATATTAEPVVEEPKAEEPKVEEAVVIAPAIEVTESERKIEDLKEQLESAYADYDKMEELKDKAEKELKDLNEKYQQALSDLNKKEDELISARKNISESEKSSSTTVTDLSNQVADLKKQLEEANDLAKKRDTDIADLEKKLTAADAEKKEAERKLVECNHSNADNDAKFAKEMNDCKAQLAAADSKIKDLEAKLKEAEEQRDSFKNNTEGVEALHKEAIDKITAEKAAVEKDLAEKDAKIAELGDEVDKLNKLIDTMVAARKAAEEAAEEEDKGKVKLPIFAREGISAMSKEEKAKYTEIIKKAEGIIPVEGVITTVNALSIKNNKKFIDEDQYVMILANGKNGYVRDNDGNYISVFTIDNVAVPELFEDNAELNKTANQVKLANSTKV